jgi:hypothetical protein
VFLAGVVILAAWVAIPVHAHRVAMRRRAALDMPAGSSGAVDLLWLAPVIVVLSTLLWTSAGRLGDPGVVLGDYVTHWRAGRADAAAAMFERPPPPGVVAVAWERQLASLRNDLVRLAAVNGAASGIDPSRPLETVRWTTSPGSGRGTYAVDLEVVRQESVRSQLFGLLPSTSQRLVTVEQLGRAELRLVDLDGPFAGQAWRIVLVDIGGIKLDS